MTATHRPDRRWTPAWVGAGAAAWWLGLALVTHAQTPAGGSDAIPRHPLELEALTEPRAVIAKLPAEVERSQRAGDTRQLALLYLAEANACRVVADWPCQRKAGIQARQAARQIKDPILEVRALIAESRGSMIQQDFTHAERLLGEAELLLKRRPFPELHADVMLAYSSLSNFIGKHTLAAEYAERGLADLVDDQALAMQVRLLRNLARARSDMGDLDSARTALQRAQPKVMRIEDPKLEAEILLESARLARAQHDYATHDAYVLNVRSKGEQLGSAEMVARAREALGLGYLQQGKWADAEVEFQAATKAYERLSLLRDERRLLRQLLGLESESRLTTPKAAALMKRIVKLESGLDESDRTQAADDFDARLKYAQQQLDVDRLKVESQLAKEREAGLARSNRLTTVAAILGGVLVLVLAVSFALQRRTNRLLRSAFAKLHASQSQTQDLLRLNAGYVFLLDLQGRLLQGNPAMAFALGRSPKSLVGTPLADFLGSGGEAVMQAYLQRLQERREDECDLDVRDVQGRERRWRVVSRLSSPRAAGAYIVGNAVDVTEQLHQVEILREQSLRDALTGCYNRRYLDVFEARQRDTRWGAITIDLDNFKQINDVQGHDRGDHVLQEIAGFLSERVRGDDAVVRMGGDEFLVLLARADEALLERLLTRLQQDAAQAACGFSVGGQLREGGETLADTLTRADAVMYRAKRENRKHRR